MTPRRLILIAGVVLALTPVLVSAATKNAWGVTLPPDAAPLDQQFVRLLGPDGTTADFAVSVYKRPANSQTSIESTPFFRIDKNFELQPTGVLSYSSSADGRTWTFKMDPQLKWSDGNPVTADDVVYTFQYQADPKHAWDFAWFWSDIVNWDNAVAGKVPTSAIGVKKVDTYTVTFTTNDPSPYFPSKCLYVRPLSKAAMLKYGEYYNSDPKTAVSSSPWILKEWTKGVRIVYGPNTKYTGRLKPYIEYFVYNLGLDMSAEFPSYQNGEIDMATNFSPANIAQVAADPQLSKEYHPGYGDFRTYYLGFDTTQPPFNDLRVRTAFAKAIDRNSIIKNVVGRQGMAAYSFLMPGFPDANSTALAEENVNKFDIAAAQKLLSDAGYPGGKGFPSLEMWLRQENDFNKAIAGAIAGMLKDNLGIDVQVANKDTKTFMDTLNAHKLPFYYLSYGFDFLDPSNMLGIWVSGGRHTWSNPEFDRLMKDASALTGNKAKRDQEFKDAEKILVDDVGGIFIYHVTPGTIYRTYLKGTQLDPDKTGVATMHWPTFEDAGVLNESIYVDNTVPKDRHR